MRLTRRTLAIDNIEAMVRFYNGVFGSELVEVTDGIYAGNLLGLPLVACDTRIAEVVAEQGRLQLTLAVEDPDALKELAIRFGGRIEPEVEGFTMVDPDGNTWVIEPGEAVHSPA